MDHPHHYSDAQHIELNLLKWPPGYLVAQAQYNGIVLEVPCGQRRTSSKCYTNSGHYSTPDGHESFPWIAYESV